MIFETYPDDHPVKDLIKRQDKPFPRAYITKLAKTILRLSKIQHKGVRRESHSLGPFLLVQ